MRAERRAGGLVRDKAVQAPSFPSPTFIGAPAITDLAGISTVLDAIVGITQPKMSAARRATTPIAPIISFVSINATTTEASTIMAYTRPRSRGKAALSAHRRSHRISESDRGVLRSITARSASAPSRRSAPMRSSGRTRCSINATRAFGDPAGVVRRCAPFPPGGACYDHYRRSCEKCGKSFEPRAGSGGSRQRYCCTRCRLSFHRERLRSQRIRRYAGQLPEPATEEPLSLFEQAERLVAKLRPMSAAV